MAESLPVQAQDTPEPKGSRTLTVTWAPAAVERAVERVAAVTAECANGPDGPAGPVAWMDLACLVDVARAVLNEDHETS